ncbi:cytochrome P450 4C1 isoform X2 [Helicoverpa armigera]|uniref:cytochrome P450 4C1 isoform X2 n=1 Tax=Helicoverpa armigera TaxID=29058 RepID=UPI00308287CF
MVLGVLIIACCVLFAVWRLVKPWSPSPAVDPRKLGSDSSLSWFKPRSLKSPPMYPGWLPLIGHGYQLIGDAMHMWKCEKQYYDFCLKNNDLIQIRLGTHPTFILTDPDDSLTVANNCLEKPSVYRYGENVYGRGLVTANETTFGTKVENNETLKKYSDATEKVLMLILERTQNIWLHLSFIYKMTTSGRESNKLANIMKDITESVMNNRKSELKSANKMDQLGESATEDFVSSLDRMLYLADKQNAFTDDEIREHLDTIVGGAYDTTATSLTFILIVIGSHPDVQEKMYQELQKVLEDEERDINKHDLPKLVYMEAVIKETLRLYPPVPRFARTSNVDVKLKNYTLPANCTYMICVYGLHRHAMWGPDKDQFIPDRWLDPARLPKNPNCFASFSMGRRNCIGKLYAVMLIKTTLAYILRHYRIHSDLEKLETRCDIFLKPVAGHFISLEPRV